MFHQYVSVGAGMGSGQAGQISPRVVSVIVDVFSNI